MLQSDLCDYSDAYIVAKGYISLTKTVNRNFLDVRNRFLAFKNNSISTDCSSKIKWCFNRQYRRFRCCNACLQFA